MGGGLTSDVHFPTNGSQTLNAIHCKNDHCCVAKNPPHNSNNIIECFLMSTILVKNHHFTNTCFFSYNFSAPLIRLAKYGALQIVICICTVLMSSINKTDKQDKKNEKKTKYAKVWNQLSFPAAT